ncbi:MAG: IS66 family transposase [Muribaculaceae bacterium]|nr:IS66 family transposase [Muribaculaceae bacterium]MCM1505364.1 IS66 family transposase [Muribaculum sp.]
MKTTLKLPDTLEACHEMIIDMALQIAQLQRRLFGSLTDRAVKYDEPSLFEEFDKEAQLKAAEKLDKATRQVGAAAEKRRKAAKEVNKSSRPAKYNAYGLPEETRTELPEGINIEDYDIIGHDTLRILHHQPQRLWVEVVVRPLLRLKKDKDNPNPIILQASKPRMPLGGNRVAADLLANLVINKYSYHLPEYRQVKMFADPGLKLPTSTVNDWNHSVAQLLYPLYESQREAIIAGGYLQVDEVPWKIADRMGQACRNGYAWQFRDVSAGSRGTFFYYYKGSRAGEIARTQLRDFKGAIQTDGYKVYDYFENVPGITNLACMAHMRRKFVDAQSGNPLAGEAVKYFATLYTLEENLREAGASPMEIAAKRQELAIPILDGIEAWMSAALQTCTPKEPLAKAIKYARSLWPRLKRYTESGLYQIDSNPVERGQRPTVPGRKNYLFSQNDRGAEDNAIFYTFLVSCDILRVNHLDWLQHTLEHLRPEMEEQQLIQLLPYNYKADSK